MEDSRNIIKAIDALTLKAGGGVIDSKNITEAIDHLKEVYDQKAIAIDDTLTREGFAADAKAIGNAINTLNSLFAYRFFTFPYAENATSITGAFSMATDGQTWIMNIKHYTSSTSVVNMVYVIARSGGVWSFNQVTSFTTLGTITNITNNGKNVTFTFDKPVFCSIQFLALN